MQGPTVDELVARMRAARERERPPGSAARVHRGHPGPQAPLEGEGHRTKPRDFDGVREDLQRRGWAVIYSRTLGQQVLWLRDSGIVVPDRWRRYVAYTLAELAALRGATKDELLQIHAAKRVLGGRVLPPGAVAARSGSTGREQKNPDAPPAEPCCACGHRDWWRRPGGPWTCAVCHPPAVEPVDRVKRPAPRPPRPARRTEPEPLAAPEAPKGRVPRCQRCGAEVAHWSVTICQRCRDAERLRPAPLAKEAKAS